MKTRRENMKMKQNKTKSFNKPVKTNRSKINTKSLRSRLNSNASSDTTETSRSLTKRGYSHYRSKKFSDYPIKEKRSVNTRRESRKTKANTIVSNKQKRFKTKREIKTKH